MSTAEGRIIPSLAVLSADWDDEDLETLTDGFRLKTAARLTTSSRYSYSQRNRLKRKFRFESDSRGDMLRYLHQIFINLQNMVSYVMAPHRLDDPWLRYAITGRC